MQPRYIDVMDPRKSKKGEIYEVIWPMPGKSECVRVWRNDEGRPYIRLARLQESASPGQEESPFRTFITEGQVHRAKVVRGAAGPVFVEAGRAPAPPNNREGWGLEDVSGHDECPDPLSAESESEFMKTMREYRLWAGQPSFRDMRMYCGYRVSTGSFCTVLKGETLPKLKFVEAFVIACGGGMTDLRRWTTAWRRISKQKYREQRSVGEVA